MLRGSCGGPALLQASPGPVLSTFPVTGTTLRHPGAGGGWGRDTARAVGWQERDTETLAALSLHGQGMVWLADVARACSGLPTQRCSHEPHLGRRDRFLPQFLSGSSAAEQKPSSEC